MQTFTLMAVLLALASVQAEALARTSPNSNPILTSRQNGGDDWCDYCQWCGDSDLGTIPDCGDSYTSTDGKYYTADGSGWGDCCVIAWGDDSVTAFSYSLTATSNQCTLFQSNNYNSAADSNAQSGYFVAECGSSSS